MFLSVPIDLHTRFARQFRTRADLAGMARHVLHRQAPQTKRRAIVTALILGLATILIRLPDFGNPTYHIDEAFYLFVGQAMHAGLMPYADVWDRKPAGLFILYAAIASFGSVNAYQIAASLFAWATALTLTRIALRFAGPIAATTAGIVYLALLNALAGGGGQSPVFYNFLVALAALLAVRRLLGVRKGAGADGVAAMLLCGLALTMKPTTLPEAIFLALVFLACHWREHRSARSLALYAARLATSALAPTALLLAGFAATGMLNEYLFATVGSIFQTQPTEPNATAVRLGYLAVILWLTALMAAAGFTIVVRRAIPSAGHHRLVAAFLIGWLAAAIAGFLLVPNFYDHYALPLAAVLALATAPVFDRRPFGPLFAVLTAGYLFLVSGYPAGQVARTAAAQEGFAAATTLISHNAAGGCLFVYDATPALYRAAPPCPGLRFAFPEHLSNAREAGAIGADPLEATTRVLAARPSIIVAPMNPSLTTPNLATRNLVERALVRNYTEVGRARLVDVVGRQDIAIWALDSAPAPETMSVTQRRGLGPLSLQP